MIIMNIKGGLGNQMFQYALGRKLSILNNTPLKLDISDLVKKENVNYTKRDFDLDNFNIKCDILSPTESSYYRNEINKRFNKLINTISPYRYKSYISENNLSFNLKILKTTDNTYFDGYWQNEKYFRNIREHLLSEFSLRDEINYHIQSIKNKIVNSNSISLHIRRGDYVNKYSDHYHLMDVKYYKEAIDKISKNNKDVTLFVFSDDIEWSRKNLIFDYETIFVEPNKSHIDMFLMSLCKHNVIANSTFSWWGAWLNSNPHKICVAPKNWFLNESANFDIIPMDWHII